MLKSNYPNRRSPDGRWAKIGKVGRRRHRFLLILGRPTTFFVEAPNLKVSLTDPPIFRGFVIGEASGDGRPMIGRQSADFLKKFYHVIGRRSAKHRASIGRRSPDGRSMTFYRRAVGRQTPDIGCKSVVDRPTLVYVILFKMHVYTLFMKLNDAFISFSFHWTFCTNIICFCIGYSNYLYDVWNIKRDFS